VSLKPRVVVVDHSTETADVLQAVFAPRGVEVERRRIPARRRGAPQDAEVFVLDEECLAKPSSLPSPTPERRNRVVLGSPDSHSGQGTSSNDQANYIPKPFQYAELIQAVELLLAQRDAQRPEDSGRRAA
jgi:CheY-like chemotaxis protein